MSGERGVGGGGGGGGRGGGKQEFKRCLGQVFASKFYFNDGVSADLTETAVSADVELKTNRDKISLGNTHSGWAERGSRVHKYPQEDLISVLQ